MKLIENKTQFTHINMPFWGVGTYRKSEGDYITVEFENAGIKKFSTDCINTKLKVVAETGQNGSLLYSKQETSNIQNSHLVQYDGESDDIAGKNVIRAFEGNDSVIFNESYIIIGEHTKALKIHAIYDLIIMGDVVAQECVVNGSLTIIGTVHIANLTCCNDLICKGDLYSDTIYVGGDMIVDSVVCDELVCDGNVAIQTTVNINRNAQIGKTILACEGIMGAGKFSATNGIANEYFEFDGEYKGKILELDLNNTISNFAPAKSLSVETIEETICLANKKLLEEYNKYPSLDEFSIKERLRFLGALEKKELRNLTVVGSLFSWLVNLSYRDKIETIGEYLTALVAKRDLPSEAFSYESVDHIGKFFIPNAKKEIDNLFFKPTSVEQFAKVLSMAAQFKEELSEDWEILMDKIFESIGLKYATVYSMINRNRPQKSVECKDIDISLEAIAKSAEQQEPFSVIPRTKRSDFLASKLSCIGKKFGLTAIEIKRLETIKICTVGDLVTAFDSTLKKTFVKKISTMKHLIQVREKIIEKLSDIE